MNSFEEKVKALKEQFNNKLTKESPKEELDFIASANKAIDSLQEDYQTLKAEKISIQEMYIKAINTSGSSEAPKDDESEKTPRTLEEIGADLLAKQGGK